MQHSLTMTVGTHQTKISFSLLYSVGVNRHLYTEGVAPIPEIQTGIVSAKLTNHCAAFRAHRFGDIYLKDEFIYT